MDTEKQKGAQSLSARGEQPGFVFVVEVTESPLRSVFNLEGRVL
jgi:hypothetical protein